MVYLIIFLSLGKRRVYMLIFSISSKPFLNICLSSVISKCKNLPNDSFVSTYRMRSYLTGKTVTLPSGDEVKVTGIDNRCGLVIERSNGSVETITTSDVSVKISSKNSLN